jgi:hypothetical protein
LPVGHSIEHFGMKKQNASTMSSMVFLLTNQFVQIRYLP